MLNVYFTAGHPELNDTARIIHLLDRAGVDLVDKQLLAWCGFQFEQIGEAVMTDSPGSTVQAQKAAVPALSQGVLSNQFLGQFVVEIGASHK